jgi:2-methylcitrate dehydratase
MTGSEESRIDGPGVVEQLAGWVLAVRTEDLTQAVRDQAKLLLLDTIGCGFAALDEPSACALLAVVEGSGGAPQCTVIGRAHRTSAANATLANGALVRILDFNDYVNAKAGDLGGHPSDNIPVALAAGELHRASGREVIAAIVLGYEIFGRCKELMERDSAWVGVTVSGLVAPAMAGRLMGLDRHRLAHAIALSGARAATSTAVRFGDISAAKSIANALVAQNGVQAALLAERGITGPLDLFENPRGMREVFSKGDAAADLTAPLPAESAIMSRRSPAWRRDRASPRPASRCISGCAARWTGSAPSGSSFPTRRGCGGRRMIPVASSRCRAKLRTTASIFSRPFRSSMASSGSPNSKGSAGTTPRFAR